MNFCARKWACIHEEEVCYALYANGWLTTYLFDWLIFSGLVQVVIDAQWLITVPPEAVKVISNSGEEVWVCNHYTFKASGSLGAMTDMSNFVRNEFENHILSLVYIMFLILITTLLALNAHGIITNHRESVFIGIASGFRC